MRRLTTLFFTLFLAVELVSAQTDLKFENTTHDFGTIKEEIGNASYTFKFTNTAKTPIVITDAKASCGCTTPSWSKGSIAPGAEGFVTASYSTVSRPGPFEKYITVMEKEDTAKSAPKNMLLVIKGNVTPRVKTIADFYPTLMGSLRASSSQWSFNRVYFGKMGKATLKLLNAGTTPVTLVRMEPQPYLTFDLKPNTVLQPKDTLVITATLDSKKANDWGWLTSQTILVTDDKPEANKSFYSSAEVDEEFPVLTEKEKADAPKIAFAEGTTHDFGTIKAGTQVTYEFKFTNTGKHDLVIHKTKASCGCTASAPEKTTMKPGESSAIKVTFDSTGKNGEEQKSVNVISNDPTQPNLNLIIKAKVEAAQASASAH